MTVVFVLLFRYRDRQIVRSTDRHPDLVPKDARPGFFHITMRAARTRASSKGSHGLSRRTWSATMRVHDAAMAAGTVTNYESAVRHFAQWRRAERILASDTVSTPEPILCAYAASLAGVYAAGTARSKLAGLKFWHERRALRWKGSPRLDRILKGVAMCAPPDSHREERPPVTEAMLDEALHELDDSRPFDVCVAAAMLVAFWGQLRLGEILSATRSYDTTALPTGACVRLRGDAGGKPSQVTSALWLPRTKVERSGTWVWLARHYNDPSFALAEHVRINGIAAEDPLFAYTHDTTGELVPLTRRAFLSRLNEIWSAAGMQRITGHCFRIGGTTALLRAGVEPDVVKMAGRWRSDSFLRYWRAIDNIISSHMDLCDLHWSASNDIPEY